MKNPKKNPTLTAGSRKKPDRFKALKVTKTSANHKPNQHGPTYNARSPQQRLPPLARTAIK